MLLTWHLARTQLSLRRGFTLIEILAVLVITGVLAALAVPTGINTYARIQLDEAESQVAAALRSARTNARASLQGRFWEVRIDSSGEVPVVVIEDGSNDTNPASQVSGVCDELTPCQRIPLSRWVTISETFDGYESAFFNSNGGARRPDTNGVHQGSFVIESTFIQGARRCVIVSTILGNVRQDDDPSCP